MGFLAQFGARLFLNALTGSMQVGANDSQQKLNANFAYSQGAFLRDQAVNMRVNASIDNRLGHMALDRHIATLNTHRGVRTWTGTTMYLKSQERKWGSYALERKLQSDLLSAYYKDVEADFMHFRGDAHGLQAENFRRNVVAKSLWNLGTWAMDSKFKWPGIFPSGPLGVGEVGDDVDGINTNKTVDFTVTPRLDQPLEYNLPGTGYQWQQELPTNIPWQEALGLIAPR